MEWVIVLITVFAVPFWLLLYWIDVLQRIEMQQEKMTKLLEQILRELKSD